MNKMEERHFTIYEVGTWASPWTDASLTITETELKRRINAMMSTSQEPHGGIDTLIDILLHGEKPHQPIPVKNDTDATRNVKWNTNTSDSPETESPWQWADRQTHNQRPNEWPTVNISHEQFKTVQGAMPAEPPIVNMGIACPKCGGTEYQCAECLETVKGE